jgi:hypothetical protein
MYGGYQFVFCLWNGRLFCYSNEELETADTGTCWLFLIIALGLFTVRVTLFPLYAPRYIYLLVVESQCWIFSVFAFGRYLNHSSKVLNYLSEAAYPVYILSYDIFIPGVCVDIPIGCSSFSSIHIGPSVYSNRLFHRI